MGTTLTPGGGATAGGKKRKMVTSKKTNLVRAKVEPKTFFANERTFIQWLSAAILLATLSTAIMSFSDTARIAGTIFFPVALMFMFYALFTYTWRLNKIKNRDGDRFDDPYGPWMLTIFLSLALLAVVAVLWTSDLNGENTNANLGTLDGGNAASDNGDTSNTITYPIASESLAPLSAAAFAERRFRRGCIMTSPQLPDRFAPDAIRVISPLGTELYSWASARDRSLQHLQRRTSRFINVDDITVDVVWSQTQEKYCFSASPAACEQEFALYTRETNTWTMVIREADVSGPALPEGSTAINDTATHVLTSRCDGQGMEYRLALPLGASNASVTTLFDLNDLLATDYFLVNGPLVPDGVARNTVYRYNLGPRVAGADGTMVMTFDYATDEARALAREPLSVTFDLAIRNGLDLAAIRQAEGLAEYLAGPGSQRSTGSNALTTTERVGLIVGLFILFILCMYICYLIWDCRRRRRKAEEEGEVTSTRRTEKKSKRVERSNGTVAQDAKPEAKPEAKAKREAEATQPEAKAAQPPKATPAPGPATLSTSVATREVTLPADSEIVNMEEESIVATDTAAQGARKSRLPSEVEESTV